MIPVVTVNTNRHTQKHTQMFMYSQSQIRQKLQKTLSCYYREHTSLNSPKRHSIEKNSFLSIALKVQIYTIFLGCWAAASIWPDGNKLGKNVIGELEKQGGL